MIALLLAIAPMPSSDAVAQTDDAPVAAAPLAAAAISDDDLRRFAAILGRKTAGQPVGGPYRHPDKLLLLARDKGGQPVIANSLAFPVGRSLPAPPAGTIAIIRLHQKSETVVPGPTADDLAFVAANQIPLFVVGEWARPAPMWEVAWLDGAVRYRTIGEVGEIGPWQE